MNIERKLFHMDLFVLFVKIKFMSLFFSSEVQGAGFVIRVLKFY